MNGRPLLALFLAFFGCASASAILVAAPPHEPLKPAVISLLLANRYEVRTDGTIWAPGASEQVKSEDMPFLVSRLKSSQRLKALLKLDLILTASDGEKFLKPSEREQIRAVLRENWPYFSRTTRKHFKMYFSLQELEGLNRTPAEEEPDPMQSMRDPEIEFLPEPAPAPVQAPAPAPAAAIAVTPAAASPAPVAAVAMAAVPGLGLIPTPKPAAAAAVGAGVTIAPAAAIAAPAPLALPPPAVPVPAASAAPAVAAPPAAPVARESVKAADLAGFNVVGAANLPAPAAPAPAVVPAPAPAPALAPLGPAAAAAAPVVASGELEKLLADAPYGRDVKALLRIIADKAAEPSRTRALALVVSNLLPIYVDAERAGLGARASVEAQEAPDGQRSVVVALNPGVVIVKRKRMFFGSQAALVPEAASAYAALKLAPPAADALKKEATAAKLERGPWGETRFFEDESEHAVYSQSQAAGSLLWALLIADAERSGWAASPYAAEVVARSAQMQLYHALAAESKDDGFLDPEMKAFYRQWRDRPWDFRDFLVHTTAASSFGTFDVDALGLEAAERAARAAYAACPDSLTRANAREAAAANEKLKKAALTLARARVADQAQFEEALKALDAAATARKHGPETVQACARRWKTAVDGLAQASVLIDGVAAAERARLLKGGAHAR